MTPLGETRALDWRGVLLMASEVVRSVYRLPGHGDKTRDTCGKWNDRTFGCLNVEEHGVAFDSYGNLVNHSGKIYVRPVVMSCNKPSCPICWKRWAKKQARRTAERLLEASKIHGVVEHIVDSPPRWEWGSDVDVLYHIAIDRARARGVIGGSIIYHELRYTRSRGWYFSPHFHILGFLNGGYRCRKCKHFVLRSAEVCGKCCGFEGLTRRLNLMDGHIVKVLEERKKAYGSNKPNIEGTAKYELGHASYKVDAKRANVVRYFGVVSYRRLKVVPAKEPCLCPHCKRELVEIKYVGDDANVIDWLNSRFDGVCKSSWLDYRQDGVPVWVEVDSGEHRSKRWRKGEPF
jgi:hypothetical protein